MEMEEQWMEFDAQTHHEERQFQLQMMQMLMQHNITHSMLSPKPYYPMHSAYNLGSLANNEFDPDETQDGLQLGSVNIFITILLAMLQHYTNCDNVNK